MTSRRRQIAARRRDKTSGSPISGEPEFLAIGQIQRPHGLRAEVLMTVLTDFPERIQPGVVVFAGESRQPVTVASVRQHNRGLLVAFEEYENREEAGTLRSQLVFVRTDDRPPLPEGEYYHHQLIGLRVVAETGEMLGVLSEILETGANDVYIVSREGAPELLLPAIDEVIRKVDLDAKELVVHLLPGLLTDES